MAHIQTTFSTEELSKEATAAESLYSLRQIRLAEEEISDGIERVQQQGAKLNDEENLPPGERFYK